MNLRVRDVLTATRGQLLAGSPARAVNGVSINSRTIGPHDCFFALKGPRFDAHNFLRQAADRGAGLLVVQSVDARLNLESHHLPSVIRVEDTLKALQDLARWIRGRSRATVIGVTGSNGKTTTKDMLYAILRRAGKTLVTKGNLNNHIGLPLTLCDLEEDHRFAVIEMGTSKKGDMELLVDIARPQVGLITNVGKDHLEFLGTPEGVLVENRPLYDRLPADGIAILNLEDPLLAPLADSLKVRKVTYGRNPEAQVRATDIVPWPLPLRFTLTLDGRRQDCALFVPGLLQVLNAMAAAAAAHAVGVDAMTIAAGLANFSPTAMRMQVLDGIEGSTLVNDAYNANPSSVRASIEGFCESFSNRPRWIVLGDMRELGTLARVEHEELGRWLADKPLDRIFLYGRDTRFILAGLQSAGAKTPVLRFRKKRDLTAAIQSSMAGAKPVILFKASRSLKLEQAIQPLAVENGAAAH